MNQRAALLRSEPELVPQMNRADDDESNHRRQKEDIHSASSGEVKYVLLVVPPQILERTLGSAGISLLGPAAESPPNHTRRAYET